MLARGVQLSHLNNGASFVLFELLSVLSQKAGTVGGKQHAALASYLSAIAALHDMGAVLLRLRVEVVDKATMCASEKFDAEASALQRQLMVVKKEEGNDKGEFDCLEMCRAVIQEINTAVVDTISVMTEYDKASLVELCKQKQTMIEEAVGMRDSVDFPQGSVLSSVLRTFIESGFLSGFHIPIAWILMAVVKKCYLDNLRGYRC